MHARRLGDHHTKLNSHRFSKICISITTRQSKSNLELFLAPSQHATRKITEQKLSVDLVFKPSYTN